MVRPLSSLAKFSFVISNIRFPPRKRARGGTPACLRATTGGETTPRHAARRRGGVAIRGGGAPTTGGRSVAGGDKPANAINVETTIGGGVGAVPALTVLGRTG